MHTICYSLNGSRYHRLNKIWDKIGYNSVCVRDFCVYKGVFGDGPSNAANRIFLRPTLVAMATKFGTKLAITRSV